MPADTFVTGLRCMICSECYAPETVDYVCPKHGDEGLLDVQYDYDRIRPLLTPDTLAASTELGQWRYRPLLPIGPHTPVPPLLTGMTPLYAHAGLAEAAGVSQVLLKDDTRQPSGSFKDRASALAVVLAQSKWASAVATASTGNAAAALACMAAAVQFPCVIFVPASAPQAKIAQLLAYGATVFAVNGPYDAAFEMCLEACRRMGWYNRNTAFNPYMTEGKKTAALEICEQTNWQPPDAVLVGVGDGCIIGGLHKGFKDMHTLGLIDRIPRLIGVQSEGSDYLYQAWREDANPLTKPAITADTMADSIAAGLPRDRIKALEAVCKTHGAYVRVEDEAILAAIPELARQTGIFAEPAAAASWAGLQQARAEGLIQPNERACLLITGTGLKDIQAAMSACTAQGRTATVVETGEKGLEQALKRM